jgi:hypothetical protein
MSRELPGGLKLTGMYLQGTAATLCWRCVDTIAIGR